MEQQTNPASDPQGSSEATPGGVASINIEERIEKLTTLERDRYYSISPIFGDDTFEVLKYFKDKRTPKQWPTFLENVRTANDPDNPDRVYNMALNDAVEINKSYRQHGLIMLVRRLRSENNLPQYTEDVLKNTLADLGKIILVEESKEPDLDGKDTHPVYTPVLRLLMA